MICMVRRRSVVFSFIYVSFKEEIFFEVERSPKNAGITWEKKKKGLLKGGVNIFFFPEAKNNISLNGMWLATSQ